MATRAADAAAVEAFHEAIRRQVELQARLTAFDEHVLPAALSELERLEGAAEGARLGAAQEELRKREAEGIAAAEAKFKALGGQLLEVYEEWVSLRTAFLLEMEKLGLPEREKDRWGSRLLIPKLALLLPYPLLQLGVNSAANPDYRPVRL